MLTLNVITACVFSAKRISCYVRKDAGLSDEGAGGFCFGEAVAPLVNATLNATMAR